MASAEVEEGGEADGGFDAGAGFEWCDGGVVGAKAGAMEVDGADHGADLGGLDVDGGEGDIISAAGVEVADALLYCAFGDLLDFVVEGSDDSEATRADATDAEVSFEFFLGFEDEMRGSDVFELALLGEDGVEDVDGFCFVGLFAGDEADGDHVVEGFVLAIDEGGVAGDVVRIKDGRVIWDGGKEGGLGEVEFGGGDAEVGAGGGFDAVSASAEWGFVEVEGEDLFLTIHAFDFDGEDHFFEFTADAGDGAIHGFVGEVDLFDELLGESGSSLDGAAAEVIYSGADDAGDTDAAVVEEFAILEGDDCLAHVFADFVAFDDDAVIAFAAIFPEEGAVAVVEAVSGGLDATRDCAGFNLVEFATEVGEDAEDTDGTD